MGTYDFEIAAKNALRKAIKERYGEEYKISEISVVWMAHLLGNKKAIFIDRGRNLRLYEVTYNVDRDEMYVDMYEKRFNKVVPYNDLDFDTSEVDEQ